LAGPGAAAIAARHAERVEALAVPRNLASGSDLALALVTAKAAF
jgi:hypothetical protein